jgi:hypothetical protein
MEKFMSILSLRFTGRLNALAAWCMAAFMLVIAGTSHLEANMVAGTERTIPIRFTIILSCAAGSGCSDPASYESILLSVQKANQVYKVAGIQLYIESINRYTVPLIAANIDALDGNDKLQEFDFATVKGELAQIFPEMPLNAWSGSTKKSIRVWLHAVTALYGDVRHVHAWIAKTAGSSSAGPESGRGIRLSGAGMNYNRSNFAHEFGHFLGLQHTWVHGAQPHPATLQTLKLSDRWDLVYRPGTGPGNPHKFYSSRAEAALDEASLKLIERKPTNCDDSQPDGTITCTIGEPSIYNWKEVHSTGDPGMRGMGFTFANGARGANVMSYLGNDDDLPYGISDSQIEQVRATLRWDVPYAQDALDDYLTGYLLTPTSLGGRRPRLGSQNAGVPARLLDFDADGKRDVAYWLPPNSIAASGQFVVLLSSNGFSSGFTVPFGGLGDIPVPADYNGDGRADVAVYQPGGGLNRDNPTSTAAYWRWCPTAVPAESTSCANPPAPLQYGSRADTPQPGLEFDGKPGDELSIYRPASGTWYFRNVSGTLSDSRAIGHVRGGVVPLAGLYDCDAKTDLAVYEPSTAKFRLLASEDAWTTFITHSFDPEFVPYPSGAGEERSGVIVLGDFTAPRVCGGPIVTYSTPRRSAALFYPGKGTWNIVSNPTNPASSVQSCQFGSGSDQPFAGLDRDMDKRTDLAIFRAQSYSSPGKIFTRLSVNGSCAGADYSVSCTSCSRVRQRAWAVPDMTGDGRPEILILQPDFGTLRWLTSESEYTVIFSRKLEDPDVVVL